MKFNIKDISSVDELRNRITSNLKGEKIVSNEQEAIEKLGISENAKRLYTNTIASGKLSVWNEEAAGYEEYTYYVYEHFIDTGADDYVYSYKIV